MNGTSGVSGLSGGNCSLEEHQEYQRIFADVSGWDGTVPKRQEGVSDAPDDDDDEPYDDSDSAPALDLGES